MKLSEEVKAKIINSNIKFFETYYPIAHDEILYIYSIICIVLGFIILLISFIFIYQRNDDIEKISPYECGFNPFENARNQFDIQFYIIAILFIIFDVEVSFLLPWANVLLLIDPLGFYAMFIFLIILTLGFIYEWFKGALEWS